MIRMRAFGSKLAALSILLLAWTTQAAPSLRISLLSACAEYDSEKSLSEMQKILETDYQIVCQRIFGKDKDNDLPGLEALENTDLVILFTRRLTLPEAQLQRIRNYLATGKPIIGVRTASHAFQNYLQFDHDVLGGDYQGHYGDAAAGIELAPGRSAHPVLAGIKPFMSRKLYKNPNLADDVTVLLEASIPGHREPVAWVRDGKRRVFYTSLGTQEDFAEENFRRLLRNAIFWTTRTDEAKLQKTGTPKR